MKLPEIQEYLADFQTKPIPKLVPRMLKVPTTPKIISIIGPRRAGKSYYLYQVMKELLSQGVKKEQLVYLNFEDTRLTGITFNEIREILKLHWQFYPSSISQKLYLFMDEPQNIARWEAAARSLHDEGYKMFISGSSSKLLSKEIATSLRGRTLSYLLLPFSFQEFVQSKSPLLLTAPLGSQQKSMLLSLLEEHLAFGGYPEVFQTSDIETKLKIINEYFNLIIYRDLIERYNIRNTKLLKWLIKSILATFSKELSIHKIYSTALTQGFKISKNTLYSYFSLLEDSFFVFSLPKFSSSIRKGDNALSKSYLCDLGFAKLIETSADKGRKLENTVFLELKRRQGPLTELCYWKNYPQQEEVDFVVKEGSVQQLIQVCANLDDPDTKKREVRALLKASEELCCNSLLVITECLEAEEAIGNKHIIYVPLWKWLLGSKL
ncbi:ATP-binding protein [Candidatus Woesearchaeota archaeon]|nr:ATP-binding protein [Candidatus Woesearchaeota archaeon]